MPVFYTTVSEYYENGQELLHVNDHIEMDISVTGWDKSLRIRDLTIPQREKINRYALDSDGKRNNEKFHVMTLIEGIVRPKLTPTEATELVTYHNGQIIEELSEAIWSIGGLFETYKKYQEALKNAKSVE